MEKSLYYWLDKLLTMIDEPNQTNCRLMYEENREIFEKAVGSKTKHQTWEGGYLGHIEDTMNLAIKLYSPLEKTGRPIPFSVSDALLVLYLHDLEKPWKYGGNDEKLAEYKTFNSQKEFILKKAEEYNINLNPNHVNAITYIHGEGDDYNPTRRIMNELAVFCHSCDFMSARLWYDFPKERGEW